MFRQPLALDLIVGPAPQENASGEPIPVEFTSGPGSIPTGAAPGWKSSEKGTYKAPFGTDWYFTSSRRSKDYGAESIPRTMRALLVQGQQNL